MSKRPRTSVLNSTLSSLSRTSESAQSARRAEAQVAQVTAGRGHPIPVEDRSVSADAAIATFLQNMRGLIDERGLGAQVEVELRFGKITSHLQESRCRPSQDGVDAAVLLTDEEMRGLGAKFVPGVAESEFPAFLKGLDLLLKSDTYAQHVEKQVVHNMAHSKRIIEEIDPNTNIREAPHMQVKDRLGSIDIFLPMCAYDCRVSISCEFPKKEVEGGMDDLPAAESIRHKDRTSAVGRDLRVDLTKVLEENSNRRSYEVEVELDANAVQEWLSQPDSNNQSRRSATLVASSLWKMVKFFMPKAGNAVKRGWNFPGATEVQNAYQGRLGVRGKFAGTMPVGFARWHIPMVKENEYYVSEKTDGVRYFLVIAGGTSVLVDRSNAAFTVPGLELLDLVLPEGTVLDGELVMHQTEKRFVFMVFDIIATGPSAADSHVDRPFRDRLRILNDFLSEQGPYATGIRDLNINAHAILPILRKKWMPLRHITEVFRQIQRVVKRDQSIARVYSDDKRTHYTDGIVFCPNTPYVTNTHKEYLKWKWSDLITIDFMVSMNDQNALTMTCGGPRNNHIELDSVVVLDPKDVPMVQSIVARSPNRMAVIEFGFNADRGMWNFKCARPDKDQANYIRTVLGSLMNMAESISEEELQYRLTSAHGEQWNDKMKRMRRSLLDQQQPR